MKLVIVLCTVAVLALTSAAVEKLQTAEDGSRYYIETADKFNWFEALGECSRMNMTLVAVDSENKSQQIVALLKNPKSHLWSGGHDNAVSRSFVWASTGQAFNYTNWAKGEPNNYDKNIIENCVEINSKSKQWNDRNCLAKNGFICETNPLVQQTNLDVDILKKSFETQTNELKTKTEELDALKQSAALLKQNNEKLEAAMKTQEQQANQKLEKSIAELDALRKSFNQQTDQLRQVQQELELLQKSAEEPVKELDELKESFETQTSQLIEKTEELDALKQSSAMLKQNCEEMEESMQLQQLQANQTLAKNIEELDALQDLYAGQTDRLKQMQEELDMLQQSSAEEVNQLKKQIEELNALKQQFNGNQVTSVPSPIKAVNEEEDDEDCGSCECDQTLNESNEELETLEVRRHKPCASQVLKDTNEMLMKQMFAERNRFLDVLIKSYEKKQTISNKNYYFN